MLRIPLLILLFIVLTSAFIFVMGVVQAPGIAVGLGAIFVLFLFRLVVTMTKPR